MKRVFKSLFIAATTLVLATACSDVPAPYIIMPSTGGKTLPYKNASLNNGWTTYSLTDNNPWSQGSSYTQATGYQDWDGDGAKSNVATEAYLISPAINTTCNSGKVKISFDQTIRYTNNVSGWEQNEKVFASKDYHGKTDKFDEATWVELNFKPVASPYSDWTLYSSGDIQLPDSFANQDSVYVALYFKSPASSSTTWEVVNFLIEEGVANGGNTPDNPTTTDPVGEGTAASPYNVAKTQQEAAKLASGETANSEVYVSGIISEIKSIDIASYGNAQYYISDDGSTSNQFYIFRGLGLNGAKFTSENDIKVGDKVVVCGKLTNYNGTLEMAQGSKIVSLNNNGGNGGNTDTPATGESKGDGTQANPFNVPGIVAYTSALAADANSSESVYFEGIVSSTKDISANYGNATFYISENGSTEGTQFYVFRALGLNGAAITSADDVKVGDKVVIYGKVVNYKGNTPETVQKEAYIVSLVRGDNPTPTPDPIPTGQGVNISGTTVTLTSPNATLSNDTETIDLNAYATAAGWQNAAEVTNVDGKECTVVFGAGENTKYPPKFYTATQGVRCYANNTISFIGKNKPVAKVELTCDEYNGVQYVGQTTATSSAEGNAINYCNAGTGTTQIRVKTIKITYAQ